MTSLPAPTPHPKLGAAVSRARDEVEGRSLVGQLRETEAILTSAQRLIELGTWVWTVETGRLTWSDETYRICGMAPHEFDGTACIRDGTPFDVEGLMSAGRIYPIWLRLIGEADRDSEGGVRRTQGAVQDIAARKMATERAAELGERLTSTLESATDCFFTLDREWCVTYVNQDAERLLQRPRGQLLGKTMWNEFPEAVGTVFHQEYECALAQFVTGEFEAWDPLGMWLRREAFVDGEQQYRMLFQIEHLCARSL